MTTSGIRLAILATVLLLAVTLVGAATISSVSDSTVTLTAGKMDGVQVGMTAMVYGVTTVEGRAAEVPIAKVQVTAVEDRSCSASILRALTTATGLTVSVGQKVQFQQTLVPLSGKLAAESSKTKSQPIASPSKDPYAGLSPLVLSEKADTAYKAERFDEAEKLYSAVLRAVPDDPLALQRLKELSARKRQAEAEAQRRVELAEKLKNADYFLTRGDDAYKEGDFALAASYYIKVAEVDGSYRDAGGKYWLSKALAAKAKGETAALREARGKLKEITVPESLKGDLAGLGPVDGEGAGAVAPVAGTSAGSASRLSPAVDAQTAIAAVEGGDTVTIAVKCNIAAPGYIFLRDGALSVSKAAIVLKVRFGQVETGFNVSPDKILKLTRVREPEHIQLRVLEKDWKGRDHKGDYYIFHAQSVTANVAADGRIIAWGGNIVCSGCDDSIGALFAALQKAQALAGAATPSDRR